MDDLISREEALAICQKAYEERLRMADYCGDTVAWNIGGEIKALPAVDAAPVVHGKWIKKYDDVSFWYECSECGERPPRNQYHTEYHSRFCPNCFATMDKK